MRSLTAGLGTLLMLVAAAKTVNADEPVDYLRQIKPLLTSRCAACHGPLKQQSGLRVDASQLLMKGSDSGPVVVAGKPAQSLLIERVTAEPELRMPPEGEGTPLSKEEAALLAAWIAQGAKTPASEEVPQDPRQFWSYQPAVKPSVPVVKNGAWVLNPVDAFISAEHEKRGLTPRPPADRAVLLRRVYLDLIGLPPTRDELHAFLADNSPNAYEKAVDKLLDSPQYGERWGRHWMDVWRYSDWYGSRGINEIRYSQRHIWRWRDWIVDSLNAEKGYDRMIVEMLAGDEVAPTDPDVLRATGFLGRNWYKFDRNVWMREMVEHTAMGFLSLTLKCARCHDHKFDPLAQGEYYRFRAFFEPHDFRTDRLFASTGLEKDATLGMVLKDGVARVYDKDLDVPTYLFTRGDDRYPDKQKLLAPGVPSALTTAAELSIQPVALPPESYFPALKPALLDEMREIARRDVRDAEANVVSAGNSPALAEKNVAVKQAELAALESRITAEKARLADSSDCNSSPAASEQPGCYAVLSKSAAKAERTAALLKAEQQLLLAEHELSTARSAADAKSERPTQAVTDAEKKLEGARKAVEAAQAELKKEDGQYTRLGEIYPKASTGRRLALARWIADPANPRTARVAVNHVWLRHFGRAIVPSVSEFGTRAKPRSHPELLDWLAVRFTENNWSLKWLHRLIVTSNTYRMASSVGTAENPNVAIDPENISLWRMNSQRMEAEVVRDSLFHLAGQLDGTLGGPELPESQGEVINRRSLYFRTTPNEQMQFLELFDLANPDECYDRPESVVPQQALALANSAIALSHAREIARQLSDEPADNSDKTKADGVDHDDAFITAAFEQVLCRAPTPQEIARCRQFLHEHAKLLENVQSYKAFAPTSQGRLAPSADPKQRARENLVHVLFNHNDFVTIR